MTGETPEVCSDKRRKKCNSNSNSISCQKFDVFLVFQWLKDINQLCDDEKAGKKGG